MLFLYLAIIDDEDDRDKFEIIYYSYRKRMVCEAYSVLHNSFDAEDAVHETFIKIARNIKAIDDPNSNKTLYYVLKAVKNTAINMYNKNKKSNDFVDIDTVQNMTDEDFLEKLEISENYDEVVKAIRELNDKYRDVLFYHYVNEMKISDIAELLGRKKSTVQQQLVRGKKLLIESLETDLRS